MGAAVALGAVALAACDPGPSGPTLEVEISSDPRDDRIELTEDEAADVAALVDDLQSDTASHAPQDDLGFQQFVVRGVAVEACDDDAATIEVTSDLLVNVRCGNVTAELEDAGSELYERLRDIALAHDPDLENVIPDVG